MAFTQWLFPAALAALVFPAAAAAHEYWLAPLDYQVPAGAVVGINTKNGQNFSGLNLPLLNGSFDRFDSFHNGIITTYEGRTGDFPAYKSEGYPTGLLVVVQETSDSSITYDAWTKFTAFLEEKGQDAIALQHRDRGLPQTGFDEVYTRHAKTLVGIGDAQGQDKPLGLHVEFIARTNPYADDLKHGMIVDLMRQGAPWPAAFVTVFERTPEGKVETLHLHSDHKGQLRVPVKAGHIYLLDAVHIEPATEPNTAAWRSYWAALTFQVPQ